MTTPVKPGMIDFDEAFLWLNVNDFDFQQNTLTNVRTKNLNEPVLILCRKVDQYLGLPGQQALVWETIKRLRTLAENFNNKVEEAEVCCRCARAVFHLGNFQEAYNLLSQAVGQFKANSHNVAVARWLRGCVQWQLPGMQDEAVVDWQNSKKEFVIAKGESTTRIGRDWYDSRLQKMTDSITIAIS